MDTKRRARLERLDRMATRRRDRIKRNTPPFTCEQERARRRRQIERGMLRPENGLARTRGEGENNV